MNRSNVRDYNSAAEWLLGSKDKTHRKRSLYEYGLELRRSGAHSITVFHNSWIGSQAVVTYFQDGSCIVHGRAHGTFWQSIRRIYSEYVKDLEICIRKGKIIISLPVDGRSPSKVTKCRTCKGVGTKPKECYGPTYRCWDDECEQYISYSEVRTKYYNLDYNDPLREELWKILESLEHSHPTCKHGYAQAHQLPNDRYNCYRCNTSGIVDYGNKKRGRVWDGVNNFGIDADGNYIEVEV